jgi:outer membrane protein assembly factor BamB
VLGAAWALACTAGLVSGGDWPRFRGPNGTGVATDKDVPVKWTTEDGVLWKVRIPGKGNSSPVISGNRLFVQSATDDAKERLLLCLDATTGKVLWTRAEPGGSAPPKGLHVKNTMSSCTPAVEGDRVFAAFWDGNELSLNAYDVQGTPLWKQNLGAFKSQHGAGLSPMVHDGKVFVMDDQDGAAAVLAFDAATGKKAWSAERKAFRASYSTPFVRDLPGGATELIVMSTAGITAYNPKTGAVNWNYTWTTSRPLRTVASPIIANGLIFLHGGDGDGSRNIFAVRLGDKGEVPQTNVVWQNSRRELFPYVPSMLTAGDYLYTVNDFGKAACYGAKTGEQVWLEQLDSREVSASPILVDGKVYVVGVDGEVYVFEAAPAFKLLAKNSVGEMVRASPAVANNRMYIRGEEHLFCIGKAPTK